jgi:hypothetical protein
VRFTGPGHVCAQPVDRYWYLYPFLRLRQYHSHVSLASAREASRLPCIPDLPRFLLHSFYYVPTTEASLGLLRVCPPPCDYGVDGWVRFSSSYCFVYFVLFHSLRSCLLRRVGVLYVDPFPGFVFLDGWIVLHPLRFELAVGRGRKVRTAFLLLFFHMDWNWNWGVA